MNERKSFLPQDKNEPLLTIPAWNIDVGQWADTIQYVVNGIRNITSEQWILVPGVDWQALDKWTENSQTAMINITDPANKTLVDVHQVWFTFACRLQLIC